MVELLSEYWWLLLLVWLTLTKLNRHSETRKKREREKAITDAEELVAKVMIAVKMGVDKRHGQDTLLNQISGFVSDDNFYRRALVDGVNHFLRDQEDPAFTPVSGSHPLGQLADRALRAETARARVLRGLKAGARVVVGTLKGGLF